jgi:hypothetical protein
VFLRVVTGRWAYSLIWTLNYRVHGILCMSEVLYFTEFKVSVCNKRTPYMGLSRAWTQNPLNESQCHLQGPLDALKNNKIYMRFDVLIWGVTHSLVKNCANLHCVTLEAVIIKHLNGVICKDKKCFYHVCSW